MENLARVGRKFELDQIQANSSQLKPSGWQNDTQLHRGRELGSSLLELGGPFRQGFRGPKFSFQFTPRSPIQCRFLGEPQADLCPNNRHRMGAGGRFERLSSYFNHDCSLAKFLLPDIFRTAWICSSSEQKRSSRLWNCGRLVGETSTISGIERQLIVNSTSIRLIGHRGTGPGTYCQLWGFSRDVFLLQDPCWQAMHKPLHILTVLYHLVLKFVETPSMMSPYERWGRFRSFNTKLRQSKPLLPRQKYPVL